MMEDKDKRIGWLRELKPNDEVAVNNHYRGCEIRKVDRITPTGRIVVGKTTFHPNGTEIKSGDMWSYSESLHEITKEILDGIVRKEALSMIKSIKFELISTENLLKALEILK